MSDENEEQPARRVLDYDAYERQLAAKRLREKEERLAHLRKFMNGPDPVSWVAPKNSATPDEVLSEHLAQLQNMVRFALQYAVDDGYTMQSQLSAASTATRMIQTNIALSKALRAAESKTVHGGRRRKRPQD